MNTSDAIIHLLASLQTQISMLSRQAVESEKKISELEAELEKAKTCNSQSSSD